MRATCSPQYRAHTHTILLRMGAVAAQLLVCRCVSESEGERERASVLRGPSPASFE